MASLHPVFLTLLLLHGAVASRIQPVSLLTPRTSSSKASAQLADVQVHTQDADRTTATEGRKKLHETEHGSVGERLLKHSELPYNSNGTHSTNKSSTPASALQRLSDVIAIVDDTKKVKLLYTFALVSMALAVLVGCCCFAIRSLSESRFTGKFKPSSRHQFIAKGRVIYEWDQTPSTITIYTRPPGGMKQSSIEVLVWPLHLQIGKKGKDAFLKEELHAEVDAPAATWNLSYTGELKVSLTKVVAQSWPCVMKRHLQEKRGASVPGTPTTPGSSGTRSATLSFFKGAHKNTDGKHDGRSTVR